MTGEDFISLAARLSASAGEADLRTAVSRAYYGAFHLAKALVQDCGVVLQSGPEAHRSVRWCLAKAGDSDLGECAALLELLRSARNKADYDLSDHRFARRDYIMIHVKRAVDFAGAVRRPDVGNVRQTIQAYAASVSLPIKPV